MWCFFRRRGVTAEMSNDEVQNDTTSRRQLGAKGTVILSVIVSFIFPIIIVLLERLFLPISLPEPALHYDMYHNTRSSSGVDGTKRVFHDYTFEIHNTGASLRDEDGAEFILRFRKEILGIMWIEPFTRGTFVEQCEFIGKRMSQYYLRFEHLSAESSVQFVIRSGEELSHDPKFHYGSKNADRNECESTTNEGRAYCKGTALRFAITHQGRYLRDFCPQMN